MADDGGNDGSGKVGVYGGGVVEHGVSVDVFSGCMWLVSGCASD